MALSSQIAFSQPGHIALQSSNRRRSSRYRVSTPAVVWSSHEAVWENRKRDNALCVVMLESISRNGLSFLSDSAFESGSEIWIRFQIGSKICHLKGTVRHIMPRSMGQGRERYLCGIEFAPCVQTAHAQHILAGYLTIGRPAVLVS